MTRGQLGDAVEADGVDKRAFYVEQQEKIVDFANKVHAGEITNAAGEKFTTVVQIGIGGSDLGPRAMYLAERTHAQIVQVIGKKIVLYKEGKDNKKKIVLP